MLEQLVEGRCTAFPERPFPRLPIDRADDEEVVDPHVRMLAAEDRDLHLQLVLMGDDEFAGCAVPAREPERQQRGAAQVDQERKLARVHQLLALRAPAPAHVRKRIQREPIPRLQLAETRRGHGIPNAKGRSLRGWMIV
jgi:hypothetical protein